MICTVQLTELRMWSRGRARNIILYHPMQKSLYLVVELGVGYARLTKPKKAQSNRRGGEMDHGGTEL